MFVIPPAASDVPPDERQTFACLLDELCLRRVFFDLAGLSADGQPKIVKWTKPIDLRFEPGDHVARGEIMAAIREAHDTAIASGLPRQFSGADAEALVPLWIVFGDDMPHQAENQTDLRSKLLMKTAEGLVAFPNAPCHGEFQLSAKTFEPVGAVLRLRADIQGDAITNCAAHMFFRLLGLYAPSGVGGFESRFTDGWRSTLEAHQRFSNFDLVMLNLLYDPAIEAGMDREAVASVFHNIYTQLLPPRSQYDRQLTADFVDPIDQATYECMTDKACVLDHFIVMTITGSDFEPNPNEEKNISKLVLPAALRLMVSPEVDEKARKAAERGFDYVMAMASGMGLPHMPIYPEDPLGYTNGMLFVTSDPWGAKNRAFEDLMEQPDLNNLYDSALEGLERHDCTAVTRLSLDGYGTVFMMSLIPVYEDKIPLLVARCVIEEGLQAFGIFFDTNSGVKTMFDDRPDNIRLTGFDVMMFKLLYHPLIEPRMNEADVRAVFDEVYQDVWSEFSNDLWWAVGVDAEGPAFGE